MKQLTLLSLFLTGLVFSCCNSIPVSDSGEANAKTSQPCKDNTWLEGTIDLLENNSGQKAEIIRYRYNNETVYLVENCKGCADNMPVVYSCAGEERCKFGGIAGFNTCPDFFETATDKKVIWHN